jgi:hypothetical protein
MESPRSYVRLLSEEEMAALQARQERMSREVNEEMLSHYKWTALGVLASIPVPFIVGGMRGARKFYPLLALGSLGSMADLGEGWKATLPIRRESGSLEALLVAPNSLPLRREAVRKGWLAEDALELVSASHPDAVPVVVLARGAPAPPRAP